MIGPIVIVSGLCIADNSGCDPEEPTCCDSMSLLPVRLGRGALAPPFEPSAQVLRLEFQGSTDVHRGERPTFIVVEEPLFSFFGQTPFALCVRNKLFLVTSDGVIEHGTHQSNLTLRTRGAARGTVELLGEDRIGEQLWTSRFHGVRKLEMRGMLEWFM